MRTTITLEDDVAANLEQRMRETGSSFKQTVNDVLRAGFLGLSRQTVPDPPFQIQARDMGLRPGLCEDNIEELLDQIDGVFRR